MKKFHYFWLLTILLMCFGVTNAQVAINGDGASPHQSAMLDIKSTTKGLLIPRMTETEMNGITPLVPGLMLFNITDTNFYFYNGVSWNYMVGSSDGDWTISRGNVYLEQDGNVGIGLTDPIAKLEISGNVSVAYSGGGTGCAVTGSTTGSLSTVSNSNPGFGNGLMSGMTSTGANSSSSGITGYNYGTGFGIYGITYNISGTGVEGIHTFTGNYGYLGGSSQGVYGRNSSSNFGYLGGTFGALGQHSSGNLGELGCGNNGIYGYLVTSNLGDFGIYGYGIHTSAPAGNGYGMAHTLGGVKGYNYYGNAYTYGVAGYSYLDNPTSGACFGGNQDGTEWGCLGYKSSGGTIYGGYFTTYSSGTGKHAQTYINSGIAAWGDLFGAEIHGEIYGAYMKGENYATYSDGVVFKNNLDVHLQKSSSGDNLVLYTHVSTEPTVQTAGYAVLSGGQCDVSFDPVFLSAVSSSDPVVVTVTPMGNTGGIYLSEVTAGGFKVAENNNGKSNVTISYIAIGKRAGYENPQLPAEVVSSDYTDKISRGLHNDNDPGGKGEGIYYGSGKLTVGIHPSTLPDPNKPVVDPTSAQGK